MDNSITLTASKIDLMTLEELRDPNLISRYPPLFQRRQNYVAVDGNPHIKVGRSLTQQQSRSKIYETSHLSLFNCPQPQPYSEAEAPQQQAVHHLEVLPDSSTQTIEKKTHRSLTTFFRNHSKKSKKLERQETLRRSISKPFPQIKDKKGTDQSSLEQQHEGHDMIEPIYVHALYPYKTKRSIKIKKDPSLSPEESRSERTESTRAARQRARIVQGQSRLPNSPGHQLSALNSLVVPPVGSSQVIGNPANYSSIIVHPNMRQEHPGNNRQQANFIRYDMMNLDNSNALSPIIDESDFTSAQNNHQHHHNSQNLNEVLIPTSTFFVPVTSDSDESYYSVEDDVQHYATVNNPTDIREYTHPHPHHHHHNQIRQVSSPLYRFNDYPTASYALPFASQRHSQMSGR